MKVAFISNHPAPYRDAFLSRFVKVQGLDVSVFSMFPNDAGHAFWNLKTPDYEAPVLAQHNESRVKLFWRLIKGFVFTRRYDIVVWPGLFCFYQKIPLTICALLGKRYAFVADSVKQPPISRIGFAFKRFLVRHASLIFVPGEAGVKFFSETYGVPRERIVKGAYALDGEMLEAKIDNLRKSKAAIRAKLGLKNDDIVYLMVANMIRTRHYPITSAAFIEFAKQHPEAKFVMVGKGPETEAMQALAKDNDCLRVVPGCAFDEMLELYAASDVYVHGGTEPASTALVIGAIAKLPVISSPAVGCYYDVLKDGESGFAVKDYLSESQWSDTFEKSLKHRTAWPDMGVYGLMLSKTLDINVVVDNFASVIRRIKGGSK